MNDEFVLTSVEHIRHGESEKWLYVRPVGQASQGPIIWNGTDEEPSRPTLQLPDAATEPKETKS